MTSSIEFTQKGQWTSPLAQKEHKNRIEKPIYQSILWQMLDIASKEENFREYCVPKPLLLIEDKAKHHQRKLLLWYFREWDEVKFWFFDGDYQYDDSKTVWNPKRYDQALDYGGISSIKDYSEDKMVSLVRAYNTDDISDLNKLIIQAIEKRKTESGTHKDLTEALS